MCEATMMSMQADQHLHECRLEDYTAQDGGHVCYHCKSWFWSKPKPKRKVVRVRPKRGVV